MNHNSEDIDTPAVIEDEETELDYIEPKNTQYEKEVCRLHKFEEFKWCSLSIINSKYNNEGLYR